MHESHLKYHMLYGAVQTCNTSIDTGGSTDSPVVAAACDSFSLVVDAPPGINCGCTVSLPTAAWHSIVWGPVTVHKHSSKAQNSHYFQVVMTVTTTQ